MSEAPRLFRVILQVAELDFASRLYSKLLGTDGRRAGGGRHYYDCGSVIVALLDMGDDGPPTPLPGDLYFAVKDLDAVYERAKELGCLSKETVHGDAAGAIVTRSWGERSFYVVDPYGNGLCFVDETTLFTGIR